MHPARPNIPKAIQHTARAISDSKIEFVMHGKWSDQNASTHRWIMNMIMQICRPENISTKTHQIKRRIEIRFFCVSLFFFILFGLAARAHHWWVYASTVNPKPLNRFRIWNNKIRAQRTIGLVVNRKKKKLFITERMRKWLRLHGQKIRSYECVRCEYTLVKAMWKQYAPETNRDNNPQWKQNKQKFSVSFQDSRISVDGKTHNCFARMLLLWRGGAVRHICQFACHRRVVKQTHRLFAVIIIAFA